MAPTPEMCAASTPSGDQQPHARMVISGMSGLYPRARYVKDLEHILYDKINDVASEDMRWKFKHPEVAQHMGQVPDLDRFDAQFFRVHYRLACAMDVMAKKLLEMAYEAIYDAGLNPEQLHGKKIGVYIGACFSETEKNCFYYKKGSAMGLAVPGCNKSMFANRISYWLNARGPSICIDDACCSSTAAVEQAYLDIARGECEAAIVGGANLCLHPHTSVHCERLISLSQDGKTKSFNENAAGCTKSEAVNVLFLQKPRDALRVYGELLHVKTEFRHLLEGENGQRYGFTRDPSDSAKFLNEFYEEAGVSPRAVGYVEAVGCAVPDADKSELETFDKVFCNGREAPLLVGSVMSNIGYGEAASGISGITKVLLGFHRGELAGNLDCENPRSDVAALREGRIQVLQDHKPFRGPYAAVNSMSVTGVNGHVLLHATYKPKDLNRYKSSISQLVTISGRQDSSVKKIISNLKTRTIDAEELALLRNIHKTRISGHLGRGYVVLDTDQEHNTISLSEKSDYFDGTTRPLWFVYSGMGSQWAGMGEQLMRIPVFAAAVERCHLALEPHGLDIVNIIMSPDKHMFDNILHSFVGIAAVQIGLTDFLRELGVFPDNIIGHSAGELGCAYADGCLTAEETILTAYSRGRVCLETDFIRGSMAAVGIGYQDVSKMCPPEIEVACRNGPESSTISGPAEAMTRFVAELTAKGIFAKEVPCSNIAFHSRYVARAGPDLLKYFKQVIKSPKPRSERWVSTSVPQDDWDKSEAKLSSAEYHTNNLLNPVLFEEAMQLIPSDAVLIEIAPHGLLQAILKRSLPESCVNIPLTRRGHADNTRMVLDAVGKLYMEGFNPDVQALYPKVDFPVSTGTPMLSQLVDWAHEEIWSLPLYQSEERIAAASCTFTISMYDKEHSYLKGHVVRGKTVVPFSFVLVAVWDTLAMTLKVPKKQLSVQFRDVVLFAEPVLREQRALRLSVALHRGSGRFEVMHESCKIAIGFINSVAKSDKKIKEQFANSHLITKDSKYFKSQELYQLLYQKGFDCSGDFCVIDSINESMTEADLLWKENWVTFIDGIVQFYNLRNYNQSVSRVSHIRNITIDVDQHRKFMEENQNKVVINAKCCDDFDRISCGGVAIEDMILNSLPPLDDDHVTLETLSVVPRFQSNNYGRGEYYVPVNETATETGEVMLTSEQIGNLDSLKWVQVPKQTAPGITVKVHYAAVNLYDVKTATGITTDFEKSGYGMDYSGFTERGERVMGLVPNGSARSEVIAVPELLWPVPQHWSLKEAATVPLAYTYAFYLWLKVLYIIKPAKNPSILVHGGAGAVGQAMINISLAHGLEVFATVSSVQKKKFLMRLFPQIKEEHIGNSRDGSFADMVLHHTNGKGVTVVVCCLRGDLKHSSFKCPELFGVTIDIKQIKAEDNFCFVMGHLNLDRTYATLDISSFFTTPLLLKQIQCEIAEGISSGYVRPLSSMEYGAKDAACALRLLAASQHRGRVLLRLTDTRPQTTARLACSPDHNHLIVSDGEPLGLQLVDRLISRGARKIHLNESRQSPLLLFKIRSWKSEGASVTVSSLNLTDESSITNLLQTISNPGFLAGVFIVGHTIEEHFIKNCDSATRKLCPDLKYFLVVGNSPSQKTFLNRYEDGFPATYLDIQHLEKSLYQDTVWYKNYMSAVEQALCSPHPILRALPKKTPSTPLMQQIAAVANITVPNELCSELTLESVGIDLVTSQLVSKFLSDVHNVYIEAEEILALSIERIKEIENSFAEVDFKKIIGLETFYSHAEPDELLANAESVKLSTLTNTAITRDDEFDVNETHLCVVPGLDGLYARFHTLCERLKLPALVLQPGLDRPREDPDRLAHRYSKVFLRQIGHNKQFVLLGYEFGVVVVLKLAAILEKNGLHGTVFCVGDGPDETVSLIKEQLQCYTMDDELQIALIRHIYSLLGVDEIDSLEKALVECSSWEQRVEASVRLLLGRVPHSGQYARNLMEAAYTRIKMARDFTPSPERLQSQIVLIRAGNVSSSSSLQEYSVKPIIVHDVPTPFSQITNDLRCSSIINSHLPVEVIESFHTRNLCDNYFFLHERII